jgi:prephenate dehydratase
MFAIPHQPGTLAKILTEFAKAEFNLIKIESRPIPATSWEYQFWVDIEDKNKKKINEKSLTDILKKNAQNYKIIGIYPSGKIYD